MNLRNLPIGTVILGMSAVTLVICGTLLSDAVNWVMVTHSIGALIGAVTVYRADRASKNAIQWQIVERAEVVAKIRIGEGGNSSAHDAYLETLITLWDKGFEIPQDLLDHMDADMIRRLVQIDRMLNYPRQKTAWREALTAEYKTCQDEGCYSSEG